MRSATKIWLLTLVCLALLHCRARPPTNAQCRFTSECKTPFVCADGLCREQCQTDRDCHPDFGCQRTQGMSVCIESRRCLYHSECALGEMCGNDGKCHDECTKDLDCRNFPSQPVCNAAEGRCEARVIDGGMDVAVVETGTDALDVVADMGVETSVDARADVAMDVTMDVPQDVQIPPVVPLTVTQRTLACGSQSCCAVSTQGTAVYCWGLNLNGRAGSLDTWSMLPSPTLAIRLPSTQVSTLAVGNHTCVVQAGSAGCFGAGVAHELNPSPAATTYYSNLPPAPFETSPIRQLLPLTNATCAAVVNGSVFCWGETTATTPRVPSATSESVRVLPPRKLTRNVELPSDFQSFISFSEHGRNHACMLYTSLSSDRKVACWGASDMGQVVASSGAPQFRVTPNIGSIPAQPVDEVDVGGQHSCVRMQDNTVRCWGSNQMGQLGSNGGLVGFQDELSNPVLFQQFLPNEHAVQLSLGSFLTCTLTNLGRVFCWGKQQWGGSTTTCGTTPCTAEPRVVTSPPNALFTELAAGDDFFCARDTLKRVWCMGANDVYQLGRGGGATMFESDFGRNPINVP